MQADIIAQGVAFYKAGNYQEVRKKAQEVLRMDPQNDEGWALLYFYTEATSSQHAEKKLVARWLEAVPHSQLALEKFTLLTIWSGGHKRSKKKKAQSLLATYHSNFPEGGETYQYLRCNYELAHGSKTEAVKIVQEISEGETQASTLLLFQGWINYRADRHDKALSFARQAIELTPEEPLAWRLLAISAFRELKFGQARRAANMALSLDPTAKGMKTVKTASVFGWFPLFFFMSFTVLVVYRLVSLVQFSGILKTLTSLFIAIVVTRYAVKLLLLITSSWAFDSGVFHSSLITIILAVGWICIPDFFIAIDEFDREKKPNTVKLKDY